MAEEVVATLNGPIRVAIEGHMLYIKVNFYLSLRSETHRRDPICYGHG